MDENFVEQAIERATHGRMYWWNAFLSSIALAAIWYRPDKIFITSVLALMLLFNLLALVQGFRRGLASRRALKAQFHRAYRAA